MALQKTQLVQLRRMYLRALGKSLGRRRSALQHISVRTMLSSSLHTAAVCATPFELQKTMSTQHSFSILDTRGLFHNACAATADMRRRSGMDFCADVIRPVLQGAMSVCDSDDAGPDRFESTIEAVERLRRALRDEHSLLTQYKMIAWGRVFTPIQVTIAWQIPHGVCKDRQPLRHLKLYKCVAQ